MAVCRTTTQTLDLGPGQLALCMEFGEDDPVDVFLEDNDGNLESLAGWTDIRAVMRRVKGVDPFVDLLPTVVADIIEITVTDAMKVALGGTAGWWVVDGINPDGLREKFVTGPVSIGEDVVAA